MKRISFKSVTKTFLKGPRYYPSLRELLVPVFGGEKVNYQRFKALDAVSFDIDQGETVGIVGGNGAGKSTTLKLISKVTRPENGTVITEGAISGLLELGAGFHPELSGRENIFFNGVLMGNSKKKMREIFDEVVEFSELGEFIDTPVKHYSSGMYARLGFSVAIFTEPDILLVDEVLSVGDEAFQRKCQKRIKQYRDDNKKTIVFVSHNLELVRRVCSRVVWLEHGKLMAEGNSGEIIREYKKFVRLNEK